VHSHGYAGGFGHDVKKFDNTGEETDDLISIGTVGCRNLQHGVVQQ
jgi:hypothetical protein